MGVMNTVREVLEGLEPDANRGSEGAYWCDDCDERIPAFDLKAESKTRMGDDEEPPVCPTCGEAMRFERSPQGGCAC